MDINPMAFVYFAVGTYLLLIGFGLINRKYKSDEEEKARKSRMKILGIAIVVFGIVRMFLA